MSNFTNEPPEDINAIIRRLKLFVDKTYTKSDKKEIEKLISNCNLSIIKTGEWGSRYGYAEAKAILTIPSDHFNIVAGSIGKNLATLMDMLLQSTNCGLEIISVDFVPGDTIELNIADELNQILSDNQHLSDNLSLPNDLVEKGKMMSEIYLYIYFVENCLRLFIENAQSENTVTIPREVANTIGKNKANEQQSKFLPLRGNSDLFYCDFVQLQQIITNNWEIFKAYFPQQDQHWLRVKIEDMYRIRNLIAHCGYVSKDEFEMVKSNFKMILRQLKFMA